LQKRAEERSLCLSEEEAMGLLDVVMLSSNELTAEQRAAMLKLSDFCRQFLRAPVECAPARSTGRFVSLPAPYAVF
jgi:hypothetical protein